MNNLKNLNEKINKLSNLTGCYLFKNKDNEIIYVGKAKELKNRLKQHFLINKENNKAKLMLNEIYDFDVIFTNNEKEAFILEHNLIKKNLPKYNIILLDDRTYPFIFIPKVKDPYYKLVWKRTKLNGIYFGPFPDKYSVKSILNLLEILFPLKRCYKLKSNNKACFYYHLKQCSGACFKEINNKYYENQINLVKKFFEGKTQKINKIIKNKIEILIKNLQFEEALKQKRLLEKIKEFNEKQTIDLNLKINADFLNFINNDNEIVIIIFSYRNGKFQLKKENKFALYNNNILETILNFLVEFYNFFPFPKTLMIPENIDIKILKNIYDFKIIIPKKGVKKEILNLIYKNAKILLNKKILKIKSEVKNKNLILLKETLNLNKIPKIMEFLDLSYIDNNIIACFIHFLNGNFIAFKTKIIEFKSNLNNEKDYFYKVILKRYLDKKLPNLLILDGAILQMQGTLKAFKELKKYTNVIGLVKDIRHKTDYILDKDFKKIIINNEELLKFLSKIQDLGHKIAINKLRSLQKI